MTARKMALSMGDLPPSSIDTPLASIVSMENLSISSPKSSPRSSGCSVIPSV